MYLSIHEYAAGKLAAAGRAARCARRRSATAGSSPAWAATTRSRRCTRRGATARLPALVVELDNLVAACRRAAARGDGATAVATLRAAWEVLERQGPFALGAALGDQVLGLPGLDPLRSARRPASCVRWPRAASVAARTPSPGSRRRSRSAGTAGDDAGEALALAQLGLLRQTQGRADESRTHLEAALALQRAAGRRRSRPACAAIWPITACRRAGWTRRTGTTPRR